MKCFFFSIAIFILANCQRAEITQLEGSSVTPSKTRTIWVSKLRQDSTERAAFGSNRPIEPEFTQHTVAIPETLLPGRVSYPKGRVNLKRQMASIDIQPMSLDEIRQAVDRSAHADARENIIFVHGFNTNHAEAVYSFVSLLELYEISAPGVLFSWPSAAVIRGYLYDRDSIALSRNHLERLINKFAESERELVVVGHSMGARLVMETFRQMEHKSPGSVDKKVGAVVLLSPDIDTEVFLEQVENLKPVPKPFLWIYSERDLALRVARALTGRFSRFRNFNTKINVKEFEDVGVDPIIIDASDEGGDLNHNLHATSPAVIKDLKELIDQGLRGALSPNRDSDGAS